MPFLDAPFMMAIPDYVINVQSIRTMGPILM